VLDEKVSLVTFDTSERLRFDFASIEEQHLNLLEKLKPDGNDTALFRAIDACLKHFNKLKENISAEHLQQYLFILTDGGDNVGLAKTDVGEMNRIKWKMKQLHLSGHIIQIGDKNRNNSRMMSDSIDFQFHHFNGGNAAEFIESFGKIISAETDAAQAARVNRNQKAENCIRSPKSPANHNDLQELITNLPSVPNTAQTKRYAEKVKELAS
jgi:uncharacterized protein YegL